jgi:hypothetical protein
MKLLKIVSLGFIIWGMSLLWLEINTVLSNSLMGGLVIGLALIIPTYWLGYYFGHSLTRRRLKQTRPVRPTPRYSYLFHLHPTIPMPIVQRYSSHPTRPVAHL